MEGKQKIENVIKIKQNNKDSERKNHETKPNYFGVMQRVFCVEKHKIKFQ